MADQAIRVLLIDNNRLFNDLISKILSENYNVQIEKRDALPQTDRIDTEAFDIILADPFQKDSRIEDFLLEVRTLYPRIPIVFVTECRDAEKIIEGFRLGITDYLLKPFQEDEFKRMFQRAVLAFHSKQTPGLEGIFQVCQQLNLCRSIQRFFYILTLYVTKLATSKRAAVFFKSSDKGEYQILHTMGIPKTQEATLQNLIDQDLTDFLESVGTHVLIEAKRLPLPVQKILGEKALYLFLSLGNEKMGKGVVGLNLGNRSRDFVVPWLPKIEELLKESGIIFSNLTDFLKARESALKDDVTGLYNMRSFQLLVETEFEEANRKHYPVSALFMDIDDFKRVNDSHGHLVGSEILREIAQILRHNMRRGELIFRYGGDEFVVILPATNLEQAKRIGERIRLNIARHRFRAREGEEIHITVSIGVASYPDQTRNLEELLKVADEAMYRGKKATKNVVYVAGETLA